MHSIPNYFANLEGIQKERQSLVQVQSHKNFHILDRTNVLGLLVVPGWALYAVRAMGEVHS